MASHNDITHHLTKILITHLGRSQAITAWSRELHISRQLIYMRYRRNCTAKQCLSTEYLPKHSYRINNRFARKPT